MLRSCHRPELSFLVSVLYSTFLSFLPHHLGLDWIGGLKDLFSMATFDEDAPLIAVTSRMTEANALVNRVEVKKFPFLLTRIIKKL